MAHLDGHPFDVRYSADARGRAVVCAQLAAAAYAYFRRVFSVEPDIALIVASEPDWPGRNSPYGLPYFNDDPGQIRPGILVMPAGRGDFWSGMIDDLRDVAPTGYAKLRAAYPDGSGGVDLQPFFDLITVHELGHAFETLGDLRLPTAWLSEIFVNYALHAYVATQAPESLSTLETLPTVGAGSRTLAARFRAEGYSTLEDLQAHYPGGDRPMSPLNYVWFQYRWQRLVAQLFERDGEDGLLRFWHAFHGTDWSGEDRTAAGLAPFLAAQVSPALGRAVRHWH